MNIKISMKQFALHIIIATTLIENIQNQFETSHFKIVMIIDFGTYTHYLQNITACQEAAKIIVDWAGFYLKDHDIAVSLVDTIVLTNQNDPRNFISNSGEVILGQVVSLKYSIPNFNKNYTLAYFTNQTLIGNTIGLTYSETACSSYLGLLFTGHKWNLQDLGATVAHEFGHAISINHTDLCFCPFQVCIMFADDFGRGVSIASSAGWAPCALDQAGEFKKSVLSSCLTLPKDNGSSAYCGDGIVEGNEECDCGLMPVNCNCCNNLTCTLTTNAVCGSGPCCNLTTCNFIQASVQFECRKTKHSFCDFVEYCNGTSKFCPEDITVQDGVRCANDGFCYKGDCGSPNATCSLFIKTPSAKADLSCSDANTYNVTIHPCDNDQRNFGLICNHTDIECGRLTCVHLVAAKEYNYPPYHEYYVNYTILGLRGNETCGYFYLIYLLPKDVGLTPNGAVCGSDYLGICIDTKCVPHNQIINLNACPGNCNNHGLCDNLGQCHCDQGFNQPDCSNTIN